MIMDGNGDEFLSNCIFVSGVFESFHFHSSLTVPEQLMDTELCRVILHVTVKKKKKIKTYSR